MTTAAGEDEVWVAAAGKTGYVRPIVRGEAQAVASPAAGPLEGIERINDAEMHLLRFAQGEGATSCAIGATRPVCSFCQMRLPDEIPDCYGVEMMADASEHLLRQEVEELTGLLRKSDSFAHLRQLLEGQKLDPSRTVLAGLIEGEDESGYGVIVTQARECVVFEIAKDGSIERWEAVGDPDRLTSDFPAADIGISMVATGQIA